MDHKNSHFHEEIMTKVKISLLQSDSHRQDISRGEFLSLDPTRWCNISLFMNDMRVWDCNTVYHSSEGKKGAKRL